MSRKLILSIMDRLQLQTLLPKNGRMIEMELVQDIRKKIRFTPQEIEKYELRDLNNGGVAWDREKAKDREFTFEKSEIQAIQKGIEAADKAEQITEGSLDTAKKFKAIKV